MAVMERDAWSDKRLNDLDRKVDEGFKEMRTEFKAVRSEIQKESKALRAEMQQEFRGIRNEMSQLRAETGAFNRSVTQILWAIVGTIFLGFMGTISALISLV
ncbi:MAG TPA: hypothetical protein VKB23_07150 [Solirubrobacterales bacterium]|nr:hypothetical protein [Solirubrobacterales bacterium]